MSIFQRRSLIKSSFSSGSNEMAPITEFSPYHQHILDADNENQWLSERSKFLHSPMENGSESVLEEDAGTVLAMRRQGFTKESTMHELFSILLISFMIQEFLPVGDLKRLFSSLPRTHCQEFGIPAHLTILKWFHLYGEHKVLGEEIPRSHSSRHLDRIHKMDLMNLKQSKKSRRVKHVAKLFFCLLCANPSVKVVRKPTRTINNFHSLKLSLSEETQFFLYPLDLWADISKVKLGAIKIGILLEIREHLKLLVSEKLHQDSYIAFCLACALKDLIEWCLHPIVRNYCILDTDVQKHFSWVKEMKEDHSVVV